MAKQKKMVGLDIGNKFLKLVEVSNKGQELTLEDAVIGEITSDEKRIESIRNVLARKKIQTKRSTSAISGRSVIVRYVNMPKMADAELRNTARYEANKYIPFEVDEMVLDCQRLEEHIDEAAKEIKVLLIAVKRSLIEEHTGFIESLGFRPIVIDYDAFAIGNAFELSKEGKEEGKVIALIDIGATKTSINIIRNAVSYFTREVYLAGDDFTESIAKRMGVDEPAAEILKRDPKEKAEDVKDAISTVVDDLANEIHLSFDYYENQFDQQVDKVFLSGGSASLTGITATFAEAFDKETKLWNPVHSFDIGPNVDKGLLDSHFSQLAVAIGLASRVRD